MKPRPAAGFNSRSGIPQLAPSGELGCSSSSRKVSIPEVEFLSLLHYYSVTLRDVSIRYVSIPEVEFLSLLLRIFRKGIRAVHRFQFQKWNSSACSPGKGRKGVCDNLTSFQFQKWNSSACSAETSAGRRQGVAEFQFQKWNSSACSKRMITDGGVIESVSIPEVEFLSLLPCWGSTSCQFSQSRVSIPEVEFLSLLPWQSRHGRQFGPGGFNSRSGIPQLAPTISITVMGGSGSRLRFNSRSGIPQLAPSVATAKSKLEKA